MNHTASSLRQILSSGSHRSEDARRGLVGGRPVVFATRETEGDLGRITPRSLSPEREAKQPATKDRGCRKLAMLKRLGFFGEGVPGTTVERACTARDLLEAYNLVHDVFVESGYIRPNRSGLRVRLFEAMPHMATFVAKEKGRVVGALSVVGDTPDLGLPSDTAFKHELDLLRASGARLCEVTNQALAKEYRRSALPTELIRCAMAHGIESGYDEGIATVSPSHGGFYDLLRFRQIGDERSYSREVCDPVVAMSVKLDLYRRPVLDCDEADAFVHRFMTSANPFLRQVARWSRGAHRQFMNRVLLREMFITEAELITQCSRRELQILEKEWGRKLFADVTGSSYRATVGSWARAFLSIAGICDDGSGYLTAPRLTTH